MANQEIQEALSPEEKPIIENIISLFQQLLTMQEAQSPPAPPAPAQEAVVQQSMTPDTPAEDEKMEEVDVAKSADGETGDSTAEERIEEVTPLTDQSINDLKKSMNTLLSTLGQRGIAVNAPAQKRVVRKDSNLVMMAQISSVLKNLVESQKAQEAFNTHLMQKLGVADEVINKTLKEDTQAVEKSKPVQGMDSATVIKEVLTEVFKNIPNLNQNPQRQHPFNDKRDVRKNLRGLAQYIHEGSNPRRG